MNCKRYKAWIPHAALGGLSPRHTAELEAHLGHCPSCRACLQQARRLEEAVDAGLSAMVSADPSPDFAARVRLRTSGETLGYHFVWTRLQLAVAGALAAAALMALWFSSTGGPTARRDTTTVTDNSSRAPQAPTPQSPVVPPQRVASTYPPIAASTVVSVRSSRTNPVGSRSTNTLSKETPLGFDFSLVRVPQAEWRHVATLYQVVQRPGASEALFARNASSNLNLAKTMQIDRLAIPPVAIKEIAPIKPLVGDTQERDRP